MLSDRSAKDFTRLLPIEPRHLHRYNFETTIVLLVAGDSLQEVLIDRCAKRKIDGEALASPPRYLKWAERKVSDDTADTDCSRPKSWMYCAMKQATYPRASTTST